VVWRCRWGGRYAWRIRLACLSLATCAISPP